MLDEVEYMRDVVEFETYKNLVLALRGHCLYLVGEVVKNLCVLVALGHCWGKWPNHLGQKVEAVVVVAVEKVEVAGSSC